jgi:uncharacterized protein with NAD-binding domain and iron-sulfur cluster
VPAASPIRVAIVGGGCGALATAFELTRPAQRGRYAVTVYQMGWRLGGKGASGRNEQQCWRIEEHALHVWLGFYENAFRLLRDCHAELGDPPDAWRADFVEDSFIALARDAAHPGDGAVASSSAAWAALFPPAPGLPGDRFAGDANPFALRSYLSQAARLLRTLLGGLALLQKDEDRGFVDPDWLKLDPAAARADPRMALGRSVDTMLRMMRLGYLSTMGGLLTATSMLEQFVLDVARAAPGDHYVVADFVQSFAAAVRRQVAPIVEADAKFSFRWQVIDLVLTIMVGMVRDGLLTHPDGLDAINHLECREWLKRHGASEASLEGAFVSGLYNLGFADHASFGAPGAPGVAAGQALRGALRMFFTYRGAMFWKMRAGMGDVVFAPLYRALKARGVEFRFFHRLENVGMAFPASGEPHVTSLAFAVQADVPNGEYDPLMVFKGRHCWPSKPIAGRFAPQANEEWAYESFYDRRKVGMRTLEVGRDFDFVVLGISKGAIPFACPELVEADHPVGERWRRMVEHVPTVPTQSFQVWLREGEEVNALGWHDRSVTLTGIPGAFDTWADMRQVVPAEGWPEGRWPATVAYFCGPLRPDPNDFNLPAADSHEPQHRESRKQAALANAVTFLDQHMTALWRNAGAPGEFRWQMMMNPQSPGELNTSYAAALAAQYVVANIDPSDQYVLAPPGSIEHRISPLDTGVDNLTIAGDWTACGFTEGCVEAAVMSGMLASHALSELPPLEDIVGYDHP